MGRTFSSGHPKPGDTQLRVLVTGGSGYIGSNLLEQLQSQGIETFILGRHQPRGFPEKYFIQADLLVGADLRHLIGKVRPTHLIHLAWYADHGKYWESPLNFEWVSATLRLAKAFGEAGGERMIVAGSCAEYAWQDLLLEEGHSPYIPSSTYGITKDATRRLLTRQLNDLGVEFVWGHLFYPFGRGESAKRLIPSLIEVFKGQREPFGVNTSALRGMLYVPDVAKALLILLDSKKTGVFNICSGQATYLRNVVEILARECKADPSAVLRLATSRQGEPNVLVGKNSRLLETGWKPLWSLEEGLVDMVRQIK